MEMTDKEKLENVNKSTAMYIVNMRIMNDILSMTLYSARSNVFKTVMLHLPTAEKYANDHCCHIKNEHDLLTYAVTRAIMRAEDDMQQITCQILVDIPTGHMLPIQKRTFNKLKQALLQISTKCQFPKYINIKQKEIIFIQDVLEQI